MTSSMAARPSTSQEPSSRRTKLLRRRLMLLRQVAGDRAQDVGQRDQAEKVAIFVDHEGDVQRHGAEHLQQPHHLHGLGHVERLAQVRLDLDALAGDQIADQILLLHDAERMAEVAVARHHEARVRAFGDLARDRFRDRRRGRSSRRPGRGVMIEATVRSASVEHAVDHVLLDLRR